MCLHTLKSYHLLVLWQKRFYFILDRSNTSVLKIYLEILMFFSLSWEMWIIYLITLFCTERALAMPVIIIHIIHYMSTLCCIYSISWLLLWSSSFYIYPIQHYWQYMLIFSYFYFLIFILSIYLSVSYTLWLHLWGVHSNIMIF